MNGVPYVGIWDWIHLRNDIVNVYDIFWLYIAPADV